jgi:hypothetical protein
VLRRSAIPSLNLKLAKTHAVNIQAAVNLVKNVLTAESWWGGCNEHNHNGVITIFPVGDNYSVDYRHYNRLSLDYNLDPHAQVLVGTPNATTLVKRLERHSNQAVPDDPRDGPQLGAKRTPSSLAPPRSSLPAPSLPALILKAALAAPSHRNRPRVGAINLHSFQAASSPLPSSAQAASRQVPEACSCTSAQRSMRTQTPSSRVTPRTQSKPLLAPTLVALLDQHSALLQAEAASSRDPGDRFMCSLVAGLGTPTRSALLMTPPPPKCGASSSIDSD